MKNVYLSISGFTIRLVFHQTKNPTIRNNLREEIIQCINDFKLTQKPKVVNYTLDFKGGTGSAIYKKGRKVFLYLYEENGKKKITVNYYIQKSQFLLLIRHIIDNLLDENGFIIHCSASLINKNAVVFIGQSGAGKSTIVELISTHYPKLADDTGIIRKEGNTLYFYQTPFFEKNVNFIKTAQKRKIIGIYFLKKNKQSLLKKIEKKAGLFDMLAKQIRTETDDNISKKTKFLLYLCRAFDKYFHLSFSLDKKSIYKILEPAE